MRISSVVTYPFKAVRGFLTRNWAFSNSFLANMERPVYSKWTIKKAVKDGYESNGWVYRSVTLAMKSGASVPWGVIDAEGMRLNDHPLDKMLQHPNPHISRQELFELWISWLELAGNALSLKVKAGNQTQELWPISPDRIHPVTTKDVQEWIKGYALDILPEIKWQPEEILHFKYTNPADPYWGMAPLKPVAKTIDVDSDARDWNKSAMQNQGALGGVFSFKRSFNDQKDADDIAEQLNERYAGKKNARRIGVIGGEAKYFRTGANALELDFGGSRKANMNEIFIVMGTPPQYAGSQEASTYNNYQTSELIYWFQKIIPLMDDLKDTFNFSMQDELADGQQISYFLDDIPAIRRATLERAKTARLLYNMGVPFDRINKVFKFGIEEFDGWDESFPGGSKGSRTEGDTAGERSDDTPVQVRDDPSRIEVAETNPFVVRNLEQEVQDRADWAETWATEIEKLLTEQRRIINESIEQSADELDQLQSIDPEELLSETWEAEWTPVYNNLTRGYAIKAADQILAIDSRADDKLTDAIEEYLEAESVVLRELALIKSTTVDAIIVQVRDALEQGLTVNELQQAIIDAGIFEPARALRLSRTITGTAGSMGQFIGARETGATHKKWEDSGFNVRDEHQTRNGEAAVKINARFSPQFGALTGPRYPLDPNMPASDRINCFLPGTQVRGEFIKAMRSIYHGKAVEIVTGNGNILRVTGKHPVFTKQGVVFADLIKDGDNLLAGKNGIERPINNGGGSFFAASFPSDEDNGPTSVEQVFCAFSAVGFTELRRGSASDFHGDGQFVKSDIEIVGSNGPLLMNGKTFTPEIRGELILKFKDSVLVFKYSVGSGGLYGKIVSRPSPGVPSSGTLTVDQLLTFLDRFPFEKFRFRLSSGFNSISTENSVDRRGGGFEYFGKTLDTFAAFVKGDNPFNVPIDIFVPTMVVGGTPFDFQTSDNFIKSVMSKSDFIENFQDRQPGNILIDNVVSIDHFDYSGFVYDVETPYGWLIGNNLITSNCRCAMSFEIRNVV